jgi:hypothetical protein
VIGIDLGCQRCGWKFGVSEASPGRFGEKLSLGAGEQ